MVIFWQSLLHVLKSHIEIKQEVTKNRVNWVRVRTIDIIYVCCLLELTYQRGRHLGWVSNTTPLHLFLLRKVYPQLQ